MGHISATYNSVATLFTRDFYLRWRPAATQAQQVHIGRLAVLVVFAMGALWAPLIGQFGNLLTYLQTVQSYLMMPMAGIFFRRRALEAHNHARRCRLPGHRVYRLPALDGERPVAFSAVHGGATP